MTFQFVVTAGVFSLAMACSLNAHCQVKNEHGIYFPKSYRIQGPNRGTTARKAAYDTLQYRTLPTIRGDVVVNSGCGIGGTDQSYINIAGNGRGEFLCAWVDERTGWMEIDAQLFDSAGARIGDMIRVSQGLFYWNSEPHIAFNPASDEYVVVWAEYGTEVRFQRISSSGMPVGQNITANQLWLVNTDNPSAAVDSSGNIILTWYSDTNGDLNMIPFCRSFDRFGNPLTDQWSLVPSWAAGSSSVGLEDRVAADSAGRCVVVWSTYINRRSRIVLNVINHAGVLFPDQTLVSDPSDTMNHFFPLVAATGDGHFLILWEGGNNLMGRVYHIDSGFVSPQFTVALGASGGAMPAAVADGNGLFSMVWAYPLPYGQTFDTRGNPLRGAVPLRLTTTAPAWDYPHLAAGPAHKICLAYSGYAWMQTQRDVMLQVLDRQYNPLGPSVKAADDGCSAWQTSPLVKYNQAGASLIVWDDQRNGRHDLYGRLFDASGNPSASENFLLNDTTSVHNPGPEAIVPDGDGNFILAYAATTGGSGSLFLQKISPAGTILRTSRLSQALYDPFSSVAPSLAVDSAGNVLVAWYNTAYLTPPVYCQRFSGDFSPLNTPMIVANGELYPNATKEILCTSTNNRFDVLVVWLDYDNRLNQAGNAVKAMVFDRQGLPVTDTLRLDTIAMGPLSGGAACRIDGDRNLAVLMYDGWTLTALRKYRTVAPMLKTTIDVFSSPFTLQIVGFENSRLLGAWTTTSAINAVLWNDVFGTTTPMCLQHIAEPPPFLFHRIFSADVFGSRIQLAYESADDPRFGFDIHANTQDLSGTGLLPSPPPFEQMSAAFPNPTTGMTTVQYTLSFQYRVTIALYNILGQKVRDVDAGARGPGTYNVAVDTRGLSSGVYILRYTGRGTLGQKILVVK